MPENPLEDVAHDASPVPMKRAKVSKEKPKPQDVFTGGGDENTREQEEFAGSKVDEVKEKKKRNNKGGGDGEDNGAMLKTMFIISDSNTLSPSRRWHWYLSDSPF